MFERFTDRARQVIALAPVEAREFNHHYIGTEHLLLGLLAEADGLGGLALASVGLTLDLVRSEVEGMVGRGKDEPKGHIPFTPRAKKSLELSLREALRLGHNYIGTEHVLLGLVKLEEGLAHDLLNSLVEGGPSAVESAVIAEMVSAGSLSRAKARGRSPGGTRFVVGQSEQVLVRLEAIEARLSAIEALLRAEREEREAQ
jgi:ATP-dependent Clp protease ATP-binding subunit ClpC